MKMSVREARAQFAAALAAAERGERVLITRNGKPVAEIVPPETAAAEDAKAFMERLDRVRQELGLAEAGGGPLDADDWLRDYNDPAWSRVIFGSDYFDDEDPAAR